MLVAPDHSKDLWKSGLTEEAIMAVGNHAVLPYQINKLIPNRPSVNYTYRIPYHGIDFTRYRFFPPLKDNPLHEPYFDKRHPSHKKTVDTVYQINTLLHGKEE